MKKIVTLRRLLLVLALIFTAAILDWHINTRFNPASVESKLIFIANELGINSTIFVPHIEILEKTEFLDTYIKKSQNQLWARIFLDTPPERANGLLGFYTKNTVFLRKDKASDLVLAHELGHHAFYAIFQNNNVGLQTDNEEALVTELAEKYMSQKSPTLKILFVIKNTLYL